MTGVFLTTLSKVSVLLIFIGIGYLLRRTKKLPDNAGKVLSLLTTLIFSPAYSIKNLSDSLTLDKIGSQSLLIGYGLICVLLTIGFAFLMAKLMAKNDFERSTYRYAFSIPNYGYFGYPLIEGVFGQSVLADIMVFSLPLGIACNTYGYLLFAKNEKLTVKKILSMPLILGVALGAIIGLSGITLPTVVDDVLTAAGNCMSPASMLLAGFVLGGFHFLDLLKGVKPYALSAIRLIGIPALFAGLCLLVGIRGAYLAYPIMLFCMPLGLNLVVFPESLGIDAGDNAKLCFVCNLLTLVVLPPIFAILSQIM